MVRTKVWLATFTLVASVLAAGAASAQQYRGYGDTYDGAPNYYDGGPMGGGIGGCDRYIPPQGYDPSQDPGPVPRARYPQQGYDYDRQGPGGDYGYDQGDDRGARRPRMPYADPLRGGPDGAGPDAALPDNGDPGYGPDSGDPAHKASDYDLGETANRTTRTEVENTTKQPPGTIVIDTATRHLYYTQPDGQALQYGIGVGRQGFAWKGVARVERKSEWPDCIPPSDMIKRRPDLPARMAGGIENPLGARALYLFQGNKDTLFRIHGTNEPDTIGKAVWSGCIRMMNGDVIDLYKRVPVGTKVVVL